MTIKNKMKRIVYIFFILSLNAQSFEQIKKNLNGELHLLRETVEKPNLKKPLYDIHFREFYFYLHNKELELQWDEIIVNQKNYVFNWNFLIPIEEQAYLHFAEANTLWKKQKYAEALFLWKSLSKNQIHKEVAGESIKILQEKLKQKKILDLYKSIDPYLLYSLKKNKTQIISDKHGVTIIIDEYWNFPIKQEGMILYFIENDTKKTTFYLYNEKSRIFFYLQNIREKQLKDIQDVILWIDWIYSWNDNTKYHHEFTRSRIDDKIYKVSYKKGKNFFSYYEKYFLYDKTFIYLRVYSEDIDFIKNIQTHDIYE